MNSFFREHESALAWGILILVAGAVAVTALWGTGLWRCPLDSLSIRQRWVESKTKECSNAEKALERGDLSAAAEHFQRFLSSNRSNHPFHRLFTFRSDAQKSLADIYMAQGRRNRALALLKERMEECERDLPRVADYAQALLEARKIEEAAPLLRRLADLHQGSGGYADDLIQNLCLIGHYPEAIDAYQRFLGYMPYTWIDLYYGDDRLRYEGKRSFRVVDVPLDGVRRIHTIRPRGNPSWLEQGRIPSLRLDPSVTSCIVNYVTMEVRFSSNDPPLRFGPSSDSWKTMVGLIPTEDGRLIGTGQEPQLLIRTDFHSDSVEEISIVISILPCLHSSTIRSLRGAMSLLGMTDDRAKLDERYPVAD